MAIDSYRKGWALRYLREARTELAAAQTSPQMAPSLIFDAIRKAQAAIYHSLGDPASVESIIQQKASEESPVDEPILRCLVDIERSVQQVASMPELSNEISLKLAEDVVYVASEIINLFVLETED